MLPVICSSVEGVLGPLLFASMLAGPVGWGVPVEAVAVRRRGCGLLELRSSCWTLCRTTQAPQTRGLISRCVYRYELTEWPMHLAICFHEQEHATDEVGEEAMLQSLCTLDLVTRSSVYLWMHQLDGFSGCMRKGAISAACVAVKCSPRRCVCIWPLPAACPPHTPSL